MTLHCDENPRNTLCITYLADIRMNLTHNSSGLSILSNSHVKMAPGKRVGKYCQRDFFEITYFDSSIVQLDIICRLLIILKIIKTQIQTDHSRF